MRYLPLALACLVLAAVFVWFAWRERTVAATVFKGMASACFTVLGWLGARLAGNVGFATLVAAGLTAGCVADVILDLRYVFPERRTPAMLCGTLVFLVGHVLYLVAAAQGCPVFVPAFLVGIVAACALLWWLLSRLEAEPLFKATGLVYVAVVCVLCSVALADLLFAPDAKGGVFLLGTLLFLVSDVVLMLNNFGPEHRFELRATSLALYYAGQLFIALSLQLAIRPI